jgi:cytochrome c oxidase assembly protein subunit 15
LAFIISLFSMGATRSPVGRTERVLAICAFLLVCLQATLGGLRVTQETAGLVDLATVLRIIHGCVAQAFLICLVALSVRLGILCGGSEDSVQKPVVAPAGWLGVAVLAVYFQLVLGATMRHLGAGLAIPSFPSANPDGGWFPKVHNLYTDLNFGHTRLGAIFVLVVVLFAVLKTLRVTATETALRSAVIRCGIVVVLQAVLGVLVVLHQKPKTLATFHVVLGAALLASLAAAFVHALAANHSTKLATQP